jgi:hypothetical protein
VGSVEGTSADNALAESFNATLKREALAGAAAFVKSAKSRRTGPLSDPAANVLTRVKHRTAFERRRAAGLDRVGLHTLRHSAAPVMLSNGIPITVVSQILSHSGISITVDVYGHVAPDVAMAVSYDLTDTLDGARSVHHGYGLNSGDESGLVEQPVSLNAPTGAPRRSVVGGICCRAGCRTCRTVEGRPRARRSNSRNAGGRRHTRHRWTVSSCPNADEGRM